MLKPLASNIDLCPHMDSKTSSPSMFLRFKHSKFRQLQLFAWMYRSDCVLRTFFAARATDGKKTAPSFQPFVQFMFFHYARATNSVADCGARSCQGCTKDQELNVVSLVYAVTIQSQ